METLPPLAGELEDPIDGQTPGLQRGHVRVEPLAAPRMDNGAEAGPAEIELLPPREELVEAFPEHEMPAGRDVRLEVAHLELSGARDDLPRVRLERHVMERDERRLVATRAAQPEHPPRLERVVPLRIRVAGGEDGREQAALRERLGLTAQEELRKARQVENALRGIPTAEGHADLVAGLQGLDSDAERIDLGLRIGSRVAATSPWIGHLPRIVPHIAPYPEGRHTSHSTSSPASVTRVP